MSSKSKIFNGIFFFNLVALIVIGVQVFTGFIIEPAVQVAVLTILNMVVRCATGKHLFTGEINAPVANFSERPKVWYKSKTLWLSIVSFAGMVVQSITGWQIPEEMYLEIVGGISFVISAITKEPIKLS